eukprot:TRINITY_DN67410_c5_g12_i1.p1 TRINITY_DN67410_c5_g12~~TRINITY_DN67410_c5_g12_i1.p1  ORF type:complete len:365 (-),score=32.67 TRINITY_DN67410_c5_g12_i1:533-1627(-)
MLSFGDVNLSPRRGCMPLPTFSNDFEMRDRYHALMVQQRGTYSQKTSPPRYHNEDRYIDPSYADPYAARKRRDPDGHSVAAQTYVQKPRPKPTPSLFVPYKDRPASRMRARSAPGLTSPTKKKKMERGHAYRVDPPAFNASTPPQPSVNTGLLLADELMILKIKTKNIVPKMTTALDMDYWTIAAFFMELYLTGKIAPIPNTIRRPEELTIRVIDNTPLGSSRLDTCLKRMCETHAGKRPQTLPYWIWHMEKLMPAAARNSIAMLTEDAIISQRREGGAYEVRDFDTYNTVVRLIDEVMQYRKNGEEAPVGSSVLCALFWAPGDHGDSAFGQSQEAYEARQMCTAIVQGYKAWKTDPKRRTYLH